VFTRNHPPGASRGEGAQHRESALIFLIYLFLMLVLCYLFYRAFPLTVLSVVVMIAVVAWSAFGSHGTISDGTATAAAAIIIAAFVIDIVRLLIKPFRSKGR
jgi:hypothetical protein